MEASRARALLTAERQRLERLRDEQMSVLQQAQSDASSELSSFDQHPGDAASDTLEREQMQSILTSFEAELAEVDDAFTRLEEGRYGICEATGQPIPDARLEVKPAARYTADYQARLEQDAQLKREG